MCHPCHPCMRTCGWCLELSVLFLVFLVFYFVSLFLFQLFLMSTSAPDERSVSNPLCDSSLGSVVTSDYVTPLTFNEIHFLKRRISVDNFGWHVELDQRYVRSLLDAMAMNHFKSMATPGSKGQESSRSVADLTEKLDPQEHREFRSGAGICQYMTEQHFDTSFSTKEIMREAAGPTTASKTKLKRIARYLKGRQRCVMNFPWVGKLDDVIHVTVDADLAGEPRTRCSTSGGVLAIGPCFTVRH